MVLSKLQRTPCCQDLEEELRTGVGGTVNIPADTLFMPMCAVASAVHPKLKNVP